MSTTKKVTKVSKETQENAVLAKQYQKKSDKEHVLDNPDTYIGSKEKIDETLWIFSSSEGGGENESISEETGNANVIINTVLNKSQVSVNEI